MVCRNYCSWRKKGVEAVVAQLVEHFHGKEKVTGSSPVNGSEKTMNSKKEKTDNDLFFFIKKVRLWKSGVEKSEKYL